MDSPAPWWTAGATILLGLSGSGWPISPSPAATSPPERSSTETATWCWSVATSMKSVLDPAGTIRPSYGRPYKHYKKKGYYSDVFVYDSASGVFGRADPLPLNNNMPVTVVRGNRIHMFGTETDEAVVEGRFYTHRPNLYLLGTITPVVEADWEEQLKFMK